MWQRILFLALFFHLKIQVESFESLQNSTDCYESNDNKYVYFSTKTPYRLINTYNSEHKEPGEECTAKQLWLLSRHGTRNPGTKAMKKMRSKLPEIREKIVSNHEEKRGSLCQDDLENLKEWTFSANVADDKYLVREGHKELVSLAHRYRRRFPKLLERPFRNESYKFQYTDSERTNSSAIAFAKGLFGKQDYLNVHYHQPPTEDVILRFYKLCDKWKKDVDDNPAATIEKTRFEESPEFQQMIAAVTKRLGFNTVLTLDDVDLMYSMCSYEKAWRPRELSPWCAAFSQKDLEILEYREDLEYYYEDGYGFEINYEQACTTLKDAYDSFRNIVTNIHPHTQQNPKGIFYFTHSGTLLKVLARFGLFKDTDQPKHNNRDHMANRSWRTSFIDSFGSNFALVLSECQGKGFYVTAYAQEKPVVLPGCGGELCHFQDFNKAYGSLSERCNLKEICDVKGDSKTEKGIENESSDRS